MIFIELAIGVAVAAIFLVLFVAALHIAFWVFVLVAVIAGIGYVLLNFPVEILITIIVVQLFVLLVAFIFKGLIGLGRRSLQSLTKRTPPP